MKDSESIEKIQKWCKVEDGKISLQSGKTIHQYFLFEVQKIKNLMEFLFELKNQEAFTEFTINQLSIEDIYLNLLSN